MASQKSLELSALRNKTQIKMFHESVVFSHYAKNEDGDKYPVYVGSTYIRSYDKVIRKINLTHNNGKKRRMMKFGMI